MRISNDQVKVFYDSLNKANFGGIVYFTFSEEFDFSTEVKTPVLVGGN